MSILRQNELHEQIEIMVRFATGYKMMKKTSSNISCERDRECKMVIFKVPQYIIDDICPPRMNLKK